MPPAPHLTCTAARPSAAAPFAPAWRSETVVALARGIVLDSALDRLPILADALEEAGCDDPTLLRHCRECEHHRPLCWVLGDLLDRPPAADAPRMTDAEVRREVERVTGRPVPVPDDDAYDRRHPMRVMVSRAMPVLLLAGLFAMTVYVFISRVLTDRPTPYTNTFPTVR